MSAIGSPAAFRELPAGAAGRWQVRTDSALYLLDFDERTVRRCPHPAGDAGEFGPAPARLDSDGTPVPLRAVLLCVVGEWALLHVDARGDGVGAIRRTTVVRAIGPAAAVR